MVVLKKYLKGFVTGVLSASLLMAGVTVFADTSSVTRDLFFNVNVAVDGEEISFADDMQPFTTGGRTYLSLTAIAETLGFTVVWDGGTNTANIVLPAAAEAPAPVAVAPAAPVRDITSAEIRAMQNAWGEGLVAISAAFHEDEDYVTIAQGVLDDLYAYGELGTVLFKPTIASEVPFRFTEVQAASYFIGSSIGEAAYDEDAEGFATNVWTEVVFSPQGQYLIFGETAIWMGSVYITGYGGDVTRVEKTMGWSRADDGNLRIIVHHSSVPFS